MNIHGHKLRAKIALKKAKYWKKRIVRDGVKARVNFNLFLAVKNWHSKKIVELKERRRSDLNA